MKVKPYGCRNLNHKQYDNDIFTQLVNYTSLDVTQYLATQSLAQLSRSPRHDDLYRPKKNFSGPGFLKIFHLRKYIFVVANPAYKG